MVHANILPASGSGRRPGHWSGCFALALRMGCWKPMVSPRIFRRPHLPSTIARLTIEHRQFDTPTLLTRGIENCRDFAAVWYGENLQQTNEKVRLALYS